MESVLSASIAGPRFRSILLALFAATALLLAAIGLAGVIANAVQSRVHEIGVRLALGAGPRSVTALMVRQGMVPALAGVLAGLVAAAASGRLISGLLYEVSPNDPLVLAGSAAALAGVALLACWVPARRAARVDPMIALRSE